MKKLIALFFTVFFLCCAGGCAESMFSQTLDILFGDSDSYDDYDVYYDDDEYEYYDDDDDEYYAESNEGSSGGFATSGGNSAASGGTSGMDHEVLALVNQERQSMGVSQLSWDSTLGSIAQQRARELESNFSHTRPNGSEWTSLLSARNVNYRNCGENIAWGQTSPAKVMDSWMNSSGHRQNILNSNFTHMGVGVHKAGNGRIYWVQIFARY